VGPEELKEWKMRLQHSHNEWRNAGYLPGDENNSASHDMLRYLNAYRGDFPNSLAGGMEDADQMAGNITFSIINTMLGSVSAQNPEPILRPVGGSAAAADARRRAWLNEQQVRYMMREKRFKRENDLAFLSALLCDMGIVQHGFTPDVEYQDDRGTIITRHKNQTPDFPWLQFKRPWQVRIDPIVNSFEPDGEPRWCAFHNLYFATQIQKNKNLKFRDDLVPTYFQDLRPKEQRTKESRIGDGDENVMPMYEEWLIYDADERKCFGISPGCEKLIREERDWPFEWGQLPYSYLSFNQQIDSPFGIMFPKMFYGDQLLYNSLWTTIKSLIKRFRRIIVYNKAAMDEGDIANLTNPEYAHEFIAAITSPQDAIKEIPLFQLDNQLVGLLYQVKEQIREVLGMSNFERGQRANVETAAEANQIGAGGQASRSRVQERYEAFLGNGIRVAHRAFLQSPDARKLMIPIVGKYNYDFTTTADRDNGFIEVDISELQGEFEYAVKLDSTLRVDPMARLQKTATAYNLLGGIQNKDLNQNYWYENIIDASGGDPEQAILSFDVAAEVERMNQPVDPEAQPVPQPDTGLAATAQQGLPDLTAIRGGMG
jgi:hypothetical protein